MSLTVIKRIPEDLNGKVYKYVIISSLIWGWVGGEVVLRLC